MLNAFLLKMCNEMSTLRPHQVVYTQCSILNYLAIWRVCFFILFLVSPVLRPFKSDTVFFYIYNRTCWMPSHKQIHEMRVHTVSTSSCIHIAQSLVIVFGFGKCFIYLYFWVLLYCIHLKVMQSSSICIVAARTCWMFSL